MSDYKELQNKYKVLFEHEKDSKEPFALFGFECGDGWYNIIKNACHTLCQDYDWECRRLEMIKKSLKDVKGVTERRRTVEPNITEEEVQKELEESIHNTLIKIEIYNRELPRIVQVKEKFGTLRIYMDNIHPKYKHVEVYAELMSATTCESCGNVGRTYRMGWHQTLCKEHAIVRYGSEAVNDYELSNKEAAKLITQLSEEIPI